MSTGEICLGLSPPLPPYKKHQVTVQYITGHTTLHQCTNCRSIDPFTHWCFRASFSILVDAGTKEFLNLIYLHFGSLYLLPEGISTNISCKTCVSSLTIFWACLSVACSKMDCREGSCLAPIIFPAVCISLTNLDLSCTER